MIAVQPWRWMARAHDWATRRKFERLFQDRDPYAYLTSSYERTRYAEMRGALADRRSRRALEIGCAEGVFTETLADLADAVVAVDLSPTAVARARERLAGRPHVQVVEANVRDWSPGGTVDLVVAADVFTALGERNTARALFHETAFTEILRTITGWLESGGRVLLAHAYVGPDQRQDRQAYRVRLERLGLALEREWDCGAGTDKGETRCLLSLLRRP